MNISNTNSQRHYDVDWLRTLAMGLLIIYHITITFQPWAQYIGFPKNKQSIEWLWIFMAMINTWRIPILFLISGMGVCFALKRRNWKQLLTDRTKRILLPYLFGIVVLEYAVSFLLPYFGWDADFTITFGHLWFLLNIFLYVIWLIGILIYLKDNPDNAFFRFLTKIIQKPFGLFLFAIPFMIEAWVINPDYYSTFVDSLHGWIIGIICFFTGFTLISLKDVFWQEVKKIRWYALVIALMLYLVRLFIFQLAPSLKWLVAFESWSWMLTAIGFASYYLNKPSASLKYFSTAVYPVYIIHLPIQFVFA